MARNRGTKVVLNDRFAGHHQRSQVELDHDLLLYLRAQAIPLVVRIEAIGPYRLLRNAYRPTWNTVLSLGYPGRPSLITWDLDILGFHQVVISATHFLDALPHR